MASTESPRRGEVWLVSLGAVRSGEPGKNRPAVIVSVDELAVGGENELIAVVPLSSSRAPSELRPSISSTAGVETDSAALPRAVRSVARRRILRRLGAVDSDELRRIERALALILGLD